MSDQFPTFIAEIEPRIWALYRDFFDMAERRRRWKITDDIPWDQCNPNLDPAIADVVETFCMVELYLPDYSSKILPVVRPSKGRAWFYANWGYEESKHSLVLSDWLLRSKHRSDEQMADIEKRVFSHEWNLPHDSHLSMLVYAMVQEQATWLNYRNLRDRTRERGGDPALEKILMFLAVDEKAHHAFFRDCLKLYLEVDRTMVLDALRRVMHHFHMPAIHDILDNSPTRIGRIRDLGLFSEELYFSEVYYPILRMLGVERRELKARDPVKKSLRTG